MPVTVELSGRGSSEDIDAVFSYLDSIDRRFSTYKRDSEISALNRGSVSEPSPEMREIFAIAERTKLETGGFFDIRRPDGALDPSGVVKGWAILNAARLLTSRGCEDFYVDAGGDIQPSGKNDAGKEWTVGIRNPFAGSGIIKVIRPGGSGVATSGSYERGGHIYNPHAPGTELDAIISITVLGPDVLEADRFATAAFAMGRRGIGFIESLAGFEGYAVDKDGIATMTSGFESYAL